MKNLEKHLSNLTDTVINIAKESNLEINDDTIEGLTIAALAQEAKSLNNIKMDFLKNKDLYAKHFFENFCQM